MTQVSVEKAPKKPFWAWMGLYPLYVTLRQAFRKPITVMYPYERLVLPQNSRGGFALDMDACTGCGLCDWTCPDECIDMVEIAGKQTGINRLGRYPEVHIEKCCFCGLCTEICPKDCIIMTTKHELAEYTRRDMYYDSTRLSEEFKAYGPRMEKLRQSPEDVKRDFPTVNRAVKPREKL